MFVNRAVPLVEEIDEISPPVRLDKFGRPKKKRAAPERSVQVTLKQHLEWVIPGCIVAAVKNEHAAGGATKKQRMRFYAKRKAEGVKSGFPDLIVDTVDQGVFYIEVKAPGRRGNTSENQDGVHAELRSHGRTVIVSDSVESLRVGLQRAGIRTIEAMPV